MIFAVKFNNIEIGVFRVELYFNELNHDAVKLTGKFDVISFPNPVSKFRLLRVEKLFEVSMPYKLVSEDMVRQDTAGFLNIILNNYDIEKITLIDDNGYVLIGNQAVNIWDNFDDADDSEITESIYSEELDGIIFDFKLENRVF